MVTSAPTEERSASAAPIVISGTSPNAAENVTFHVYVYVDDESRAYVDVTLWIEPEPRLFMACATRKRQDKRSQFVIRRMSSVAEGH